MNSPVIPCPSLGAKVKRHIFSHLPLRCKEFHSFTLRLRVKLFGDSAVCECLISSFPLGADARFHLLPPTLWPDQTDIKVSKVWHSLRVKIGLNFLSFQNSSFLFCLGGLGFSYFNVSLPMQVGRKRDFEKLRFDCFI